MAKKVIRSSKGHVCRSISFVYVAGILRTTRVVHPVVMQLNPTERLDALTVGVERVHYFSPLCGECIGSPRATLHFPLVSGAFAKSLQELRVLTC